MTFNFIYEFYSSCLRFYFMFTSIFAILCSHQYLPLIFVSKKVEYVMLDQFSECRNLFLH